MERAGHQLLAGAGLAGDQHRLRRAGDRLEVSEDRKQARVLGDDLGECFRLVWSVGQQTLLQRQELGAERTRLDRALDR